MSPIKERLRLEKVAGRKWTGLKAPLNRRISRSLPPAAEPTPKSDDVEICRRKICDGLPQVYMLSLIHI